MINLPFFSGLPVAVFGLGRSGTAAARALDQSGAEVWAWDDNEDRRQAAREAGIPLVDLYNCNWRELTSLILSPGIPHTHPEPHPIPAMAREAGCEVIGDIELLGRAQSGCRYVGVTGTNGKSTTTALIGHILEVTGSEVQIGGNLGPPALELEPLDETGIYVLEMSSYQLELTLSITFDVAVLLNISSDHIDRHGDMEGYLAAKRQIFRRQTRPRTAVVGVDDTYCEDICRDLKEKGEQIVIPISSGQRVHGGVYAADGWLYDDREGKETPVADLRNAPMLPGAHNWQNAAAAYAAACAVSVQPHAAAASITAFPGLAHRQETVAVIDGIRYVNDSKATNPEAAARALATYGTIYWIAGGRAKPGGFDALGPYLPRVRHAYLIGEAAPVLARFLENNKVPCTIAGDLETALAAAAERARGDRIKGAVVLLSPACASFDQFENFEARGDAFHDLVERLPGKHDDVFAYVPGGPRA